MARFLHFYPGYTAEMALQMPWRRFLALVGAIEAVQAEYSLRTLEITATATHPGEKGEGYKALAKRLQKALGFTPGAGTKDTIAPGLTPLAVFEAEPGSIEAERARQKAAWEQIKRERGLP